MRFNLGDRFVLEGIECYVGFVDTSGKAYLVPEEDGLYYGKDMTLTGCVFAVVNEKGRDKNGRKVQGIAPVSGAV